MIALSDSRFALLHGFMQRLMLQQHVFDIRACASKARECAAGVYQRLRLAKDAAVFAVCPPQAKREGERFALRDMAKKVTFHPRTIFGVNAIEPAPAQLLIQAAARVLKP